MRKLFFVLVLCLPQWLMAQMSITTQLPASGIVLKDQLWNMVITNNTNDVAVCHLLLDVREVASGQSMLNATTGKLLVGKGIKLITVKDIQPLMYNFMATDFSGNFLPCGAYTINYRLIQETTKGDVPMADEIVRVNVTPLSPPLLSVPADQSFIETTYPQFAWIPPAPAEMFKPLVYDILVVEILEGQKAKEAIEFNKPVYLNTNLQQSAEKFPTSFGELIKGKTYAWQVTARSGMTYALPTEIWQFTIGKDSMKAVIDGAPFVKLSRQNTEVSVSYNAVVKMEYENLAEDKKITGTIYDPALRGHKGQTEIQFELKLENGKNYLEYDASKRHLDEKKIYEVSLKNSRGEEWLMRFKPVFEKK
ncbi:hypothetical protein [Ferruginibacter sp. HRS2-29]|uniref:hypothetical protein n=1 Tax=Ferruginibacter sp. HRS2-29 TaxID=2487334 RepID=UPI0020CF5057|nr:hypothetical protein [Ferruginibacter sp. HRS2-29]MCP9752379.1 hypothetical protein [Ferruginibacter sp. HRS2-29]